MNRIEFLGFAKRLGAGLALFLISGLAEYLRGREGMPTQEAIMLFLVQLLFALAGLSLWIWAIFAFLWSDVKRLAQWVRRD